MVKAKPFIKWVGCHYYFDYIPLSELGLPVPLNSNDKDTIASYQI